MEKSADILIVEDEPMLCQYVAEIFGFEDVSAVGVVDGCEAMEYLEKILNSSGKLPRVILLDWLMPCLDGYHVYEKIGQDPRLKNTIIIVVSAAGDALHFPDGYPKPPILHKPYEVPELIGIVRKAAPELFKSPS